jgi:hypothetical protein
MDYVVSMDELGALSPSDRDAMIASWNAKRLAEPEPDEPAEQCLHIGPVYTIHLARRRDRLPNVERTQRACARHGLRWTHVAAVDGAAPEYAHAPPGGVPVSGFWDFSKKAGRVWRSQLRPGEIGCFESHRAVWRAVVNGAGGGASGAGGALVLEDDAIVSSATLAGLDRRLKDLRQRSESHAAGAGGVPSPGTVPDILFLLREQPQASDAATDPGGGGGQRAVSPTGCSGNGVPSAAGKGVSQGAAVCPSAWMVPGVVPAGMVYTTIAYWCSVGAARSLLSHAPPPPPPPPPALAAAGAAGAAGAAPAAAPAASALSTMVPVDDYLMLRTGAHAALRLPAPVAAALLTPLQTVSKEGTAGGGASAVTDCLALAALGGSARAAAAAPALVALACAPSLVAVHDRISDTESTTTTTTATTTAAAAAAAAAVGAATATDRSTAGGARRGPTLGANTAAVAVRSSPTSRQPPPAPAPGPLTTQPPCAAQAQCAQPQQEGGAGEGRPGPGGGGTGAFDRYRRMRAAGVARSLIAMQMEHQGVSPVDVGLFFAGV